MPARCARRDNVRGYLGRGTGDAAGAGYCVCVGGARRRLTPAGTVTVYREKVDLIQTHKLTRDTLRALVAYLNIDALAGTGPLLLGSRKDGTLAGRMSTRAINKRVGVLGNGVGIANLSPHDCRHYWTTAAIRGGSDIKSVQEGGGWKSPHMPLQHASRGAIASEGIRLADD